MNKNKVCLDWHFLLKTARVWFWNFTLKFVHYLSWPQKLVYIRSNLLFLIEQISNILFTFHFYKSITYGYSNFRAKEKLKCAAFINYFESSYERRLSSVEHYFALKNPNKLFYIWILCVRYKTVGKIIQIFPFIKQSSLFFSPKE